MARKSSKQLLKQKLALGAGLALILGGIAWMAILVTVEQPDGEYVEGEHYFLLDNPRRVRGEPIEIMEFFSYACIHCYNLEPELTDWENNHAGQVKVVRSPLYSNPLWELFARTFFTFEVLGIREENHYAFFAALHDGRLNLTRLEDIAAWVDGRGTTSQAFTEAFESQSVQRRMQQADRLQRRMQIASVPTLVVHGKYRVNASRNVGLSRMLDVVDAVVEIVKEDSSMEDRQSE